MRTSLSRPISLLLAIFVLQCGCVGLRSKLPDAGAPFTADASQFKAGAAKAEMTPPAGTPLGGYARRRGKPSIGVHDPLYARAVAFSDGTDRLVLVSADLVAVNEDLHRSALEKINRTVPLRSDQFILFATHNHSGSGALGTRMLEKMIMGSYDKRVFAVTRDAIAQAAVTALTGMKPASFGAASGKLAGMIENRMISGGPVDDEIRVLRLDADGKPAALFVNFAAHPTVLSSRNFLVSADFPGELTAALEREFPGSVAVYSNGAGGDLRFSAHTDKQDFERAAAIGKAAAREAVRLARSAEMRAQAEIATVETDVKLPPVKIRRAGMSFPSFLGNRVLPRKARVSTAMLGDELFMTVPGEMTADLGMKWKQNARAAGWNPWLIGYADGYIAYIVDEKNYDLKSYESGVSFYGRHLDRHLSDVICRQMFLFRHPRFFAGLDASGGIPVLRLEGSPYQIGYQHGVLMKEKVRAATRQMLDYFPRKLKVPLLAKPAFNAYLDRAYRKMRPHIPGEFEEEMRGLADGSGVSLKDVHRLHAVPELYSTLCANGVFFGAATKDGKLVHLRNLDWNREIGIQEYPCIFAVRKNGKIPFVNAGYVSFIGALSGVNAEGVSVGQIGSETKDYTLKGVPMPFLMRRVLEEADGAQGAAGIITGAKRTIGCNYVFADAKDKKAVAVESTARHARVFVENDPAEKENPYAVPVEGAVLRADFAVDETIRELQTCARGKPDKEGLEDPRGSSAYDVRYVKQAEFAKENFGKIDADKAENLAKLIAPGSNVQSVIVAWPEIRVANAKGKLRAAESGYTRFNAEDLLSKKDVSR